MRREAYRGLAALLMVVGCGLVCVAGAAWMWSIADTIGRVAVIGLAMAAFGGGVLSVLD